MRYHSLAVVFLMSMFGHIVYAERSTSSLRRGLSIGVSHSATSIAPNTPIVITISIENMAAKPTHILPPTISSMDVANGLKANIRISVLRPDGKEEQIRYGRPYIGPMKEIDSVPIEAVELEPGERFSARFVVGFNLRKGNMESIFSRTGEYSLSIKYYPFFKNGENGVRTIDTSETIKCKPIAITVSNGNGMNSAAWGDLQRMENWWIIYDPEMMNCRYLSKEEIESLAVVLGELAHKHRQSAYVKHFEYLSIALQIARADGKDATDGSLSKRLERLLGGGDFSYRFFAEKMRDVIREE